MILPGPPVVESHPARKRSVSPPGGHSHHQLHPLPHPPTDQTTSDKQKQKTLWRLWPGTFMRGSEVRLVCRQTVCLDYRRPRAARPAEMKGAPYSTEAIFYDLLTSEQKHRKLNVLLKDLEFWVPHPAYSYKWSCFVFLLKLFHAEFFVLVVRIPYF